MWRGPFIKFRFFSGLGELLSPLPVFPHSWRGRGSALRQAGWGGARRACSPWPPRASAAGGRKRAELGTATLPGVKTTNSRRLPGRKPGSRRGRGACAPPGPRQAPAARSAGRGVRCTGLRGAGRKLSSALRSRLIFSRILFFCIYSITIYTYFMSSYLMIRNYTF